MGWGGVGGWWVGGWVGGWVGEWARRRRQPALQCAGFGSPATLVVAPALNPNKHMPNLPPTPPRSLHLHDEGHQAECGGGARRHPAPHHDQQAVHQHELVSVGAVPGAGRHLGAWFACCFWLGGRRGVVQGTVHQHELVARHVSLTRRRPAPPRALRRAATTARSSSGTARRWRC